MAVPDFQFFMLPLLSELADGQEHKLQDLYVLLAQKANLSEEDKNELLPSGKQRVFHNRIGWARTYLSYPKRTYWLNSRMAKRNK